ncbi:MAG: hypothetical protein C5S41_06380 [Candidatus Methanomarinus sp.]|nr:MAG: hypothetical protein C5S41_06380 [ANME-2 cluster archaeon]KAF5425551.1 hypothetical protein C5S42_10330 [ANME-2 cluster archaeon]
MESITLSTKGQIIIPKTRLADLVGSVKLDMIIVKKQLEEMRKEDRY